MGELDRLAVRAMRGGGRLLDAVKDTVKSINGRLDRAIQSELEQAQRRERQRAQDLNAARLAIEEARSEAELVARTVNELEFASADSPGQLAAITLQNALMACATV